MGTLYILFFNIFLEYISLLLNQCTNHYIYIIQADLNRFEYDGKVGVNSVNYTKICNYPQLVIGDWNGHIRLRPGATEVCRR